MAIEVVITDCDGTLTDGTIEYHSDGHESRRFSAIDGKGFARLHESGIKLFILTGSSGYDITNRARWLKATLIDNALNKEEWIKARRFDPSKVAYFGDDINDLEAMKLCGLVGCPPSAQFDVLEYCREAKNGYIPKNAVAGINAFRAFADFVLNYNKYC